MFIITPSPSSNVSIHGINPQNLGKGLTLDELETERPGWLSTRGSHLRDRGIRINQSNTVEAEQKEVTHD